MEMSFPTEYFLLCSNQQIDRADPSEFGPRHPSVDPLKNFTKQVCITAGDYEASTTVMEMMAHMGLQPEAEQEKRMLQKCIDPLWISKRERARAREGEGEGEGTENFWRERDGAGGRAEEEEETMADWRE